jgi:hypothetical protein
VAKLPSLTTEGEVSQIAQIALRPTGTAGSDDASKAGTESAQVRFRFGSKSK